MGDDAEYQMELQAEEALQQEYEHASLDGPRRPLLCWMDGELDDIWDWEPATRILGIFSVLHEANQIGSECFLSRGVPSEPEIIDGLGPYVASSEDTATHEVIIISRNDATLLMNEASRRMDSASTLKDKMVAEMLETMASFIKADPQRSVFLFARTL